MVALAESLKVPTPASIRIDSAAELDNAGVLPYPVVIKPGRSRVLTDKGWLSTGVTYANNETELRATLDALPPQVYPVLLQERIQGPGEGFFALYAQGKPVAFFAHRRLREKPPSGGVSVLRESAEIAADTQAYGTALLGALQWHGVAMVEFKRCENSDRAVSHGDQRALLGLAAARHRRRRRLPAAARQDRRRRDARARGSIASACAAAGC